MHPEMWVIAIIFVLSIAMMIVFKHQRDEDRVEGYIQSCGGKLQQIKWTPFGPGWVGKHRDRIYAVTYTDQQGMWHSAYCKTSGWSGVYFTQDQIVKPPEVAKPNTEITADDRIRTLEGEIQALRAELNLLKNQNKENHSEP